MDIYLPICLETKNVALFQLEIMSNVPGLHHASGYSLEHMSAALKLALMWCRLNVTQIGPYDTAVESAATFTVVFPTRHGGVIQLVGELLLIVQCRTIRVASVNQLVNQMHQVAPCAIGKLTAILHVVFT